MSQLAMSQFEIAVDLFVLAQQIAWSEAQLVDELAKFVKAERLLVIIDRLECRASFFEHTDGRSAFAAGGFLINLDLFAHHGPPVWRFYHVDSRQVSDDRTKLSSGSV